MRSGAADERASSRVETPPAPQPPARATARARLSAGLSSAIPAKSPCRTTSEPAKSRALAGARSRPTTVLRPDPSRAGSTALSALAALVAPDAGTAGAGVVARADGSRDDASGQRLTWSAVARARVDTNEGRARTAPAPAVRTAAIGSQSVVRAPASLRVRSPSADPLRAAAHAARVEPSSPSAAAIERVRSDTVSGAETVPPTLRSPTRLLHEPCPEAEAVVRTSTSADPLVAKSLTLTTTPSGVALAPPLAEASTAVAGCAQLAEVDASLDAPATLPSSRLRVGVLATALDAAGADASARSLSVEAVTVEAPADARTRPEAQAAVPAATSVVQAPAGASAAPPRSAVDVDEPPPQAVTAEVAPTRGWPLPRDEARGSTVARPRSRASLRVDLYAARTPLLYNACLAAVASSTTARLHGLKLYRAVARAAAVAQVVDQTLPPDPLLTSSGRTTAPSAAHPERAGAMFAIAYRLASEGGPAGAYDVERLAARVAREYLEQSVAPVRALLEQLRARGVDAPGIARAADRAAPARSPSTLPAPTTQAAKSERRKKAKQVARLAAPHKLVGRRYVVGSARITVTGYDQGSGRWECTTEDGDVVLCTLQDLNG